jgi:integrase
VKGRKPAGVREGTIANDLRWLSSAFNFAVDHEHDGASLLVKNPLRRLKLPKEKNPRRPVASHARFRRTLDHVDTVDPEGRLRCALMLAYYTGRRIDAICNLWVSDVLLTPERMRDTLAGTGRDERLADHMPHGAIRWRPENDKQGFDEVAPLSEPARAALDAFLRTRAAIGDTPLFPAPGGRHSKRKDDEPKPIGKHLMRQWLLRAETTAGLPKLGQGVWHPYRRLWVVERKDLPDKDVAAAGGWRGTHAMNVSYQQADPATMLRVVERGT